MAKSKNSHYSKMPGSEQFFQSAAFNARIYNMYRQWLEALAVNRFKWINLPSSCDERYLEMTLFFNGIASIAHPKDAPALVYSTMAAPSSPPNLYDNPTTWESIGNNGWNFAADNRTGVVVYDNRLRMPIANHLDMFARRLTAIDRTLDINLLQQRSPFVITGPQEKKADIVNVMKQIAGGEPAIVGYSQLTQDIKVDAISTGVPMLAKEITEAKMNLWNDIYRFLGINATYQKSERMVADEVSIQTAPSELMSLDPLTARREACTAYNLLFKPAEPLQVVWRSDWQSHSYDFDSDMKLQAKISGKEDDGSDFRTNPAL